MVVRIYMIELKNSKALLKIIDGSLSRIDDFDEQQLIKLIILHNIPGRVIACIRKYNLEKCFTNSFFQDLLNVYDCFTDSVHRNIDAVKELVEDMENGKDEYPIVIKGFSTYVLSDDEMVIRKGDIDVIPGNIKKFIGKLTLRGYKNTKKPFLHEVGEYSKNGIEFDVQRYFPIYRYDNGIKLHKNLYVNPYEMPYEKIDYLTLKNNSYVSNKNAGIVVADANMMILIICSHAFMNYINIWSISHREKAYVKIGELWDIFDLIKHSSYSEKVLCRYIKKFRAEDCVLWTGSIMKEIFHINPLPCDSIPYINFAQTFPKCLWWHIWDRIPTTHEQLLSDDWYDIDGLFDRIGRNIVHKRTKIKTSNLDYKYGMGCFDFSFYITNHKIIIDRSTFYSESRYNIRVDFGNLALEIEENGGEIEAGGSSSNIEICITDKELIIGHVENRFLLGFKYYGDMTREMLIPIEVE